METWDSPGYDSKEDRAGARGVTFFFAALFFGVAIAGLYLSSLPYVVFGIGSVLSMAVFCGLNRVAREFRQSRAQDEILEGDRQQ